ncbi:MAG: putative hydro-lyase [Thermodesulfobacteriota bacterium]
METEFGDISRLSSKEIRALIRKGNWDKPTAGLALGYAQANLVILPERYAFDFLLFCQRNPKPCPLLEVTEKGVSEPKELAPGADLRTDLPRYRIYERGVFVREIEDISRYWTSDLVSFLLGCSYSFEFALMQAGISLRHIEEGKNVSMYITDIPCKKAGGFEGPLVVTMRPIPPDKVVRAIQITTRFSAVHGAPVHVGDPSKIGIRDLGKPDFGDQVRIGPGEVPVYWACGVTPQMALRESKPDLIITHSPGHMFITDIRNEDLATF